MSVARFSLFSETISELIYISQADDFSEEIPFKQKNKCII